jgi:tetratricopeptide (TPR) repeat protein
VVHKANFIHRDIKPENIIVTPDKRVVLIDFGTAREFAVGTTRRMTTALTPGYAPLEQYGQHARFGAFTDICALGATTYFLLTGQVPIQPTDRASGVELAAPRRLRSHISSQVSDAIMWAMEMRVDKRPQSASEFVQALRGTRSPSPKRSKKRSKLTASRTFLVLSLCIIGVIVLASLFLSDRQEAQQLMRRPNRPVPEPQELNPQEAVGYYDTGVARFDKRDYDRAIADFTEAIRLNPQYAKAYNYRGTTLYRKGQVDLAIDDFSKAIKIDTKYVQAYNNLGLAFYYKGQGQNDKGQNDEAMANFTKAIDDFTVAIGLDDQNAMAYYYRGSARLAEKEYDLAIADFTAAIDINPQYADAYLNRAAALSALGKFDEAFYNQGLAWFHRGQYDPAVAASSKAIDINPRHVEAHRNRAAALRALRKFDEARADEDAARQLDAPRL